MRLPSFLVVIIMILVFIGGFYIGRRNCPPTTSTGTTPTPSAGYDAAAPGAEIVKITKEPSNTGDKYRATDSDGDGTLNMTKQGGSVATGTVAQWKNETNEDILLLFNGAAVGEIIPSGKYSAPHRVCLTCPNGTYEYKFNRKSGGNWIIAPPPGSPPTEPQVITGD